MKKNIWIGILLVFAVLFAWYVALSDVSRESNEYNSVLVKAKHYEEKELCQKSISYYKTLLTIEDSLNIRLKIIELYRKSIDIGETTKNGNLVSMLLDTMTEYHEEKAPYEVACSYFYEILDYDELANAISNAKKNDIESDVIDGIYNQVKYHYEKIYAAMPEPKEFAYGYYILCTSDSDYALDAKMKKKAKNYDFLSPYSSTGYAVGKREGKVFVMNSNGVWNIYLDSKITASSGIENGRIACVNDGKYAYYDTNGNKISDDYFYAGRFCNGVAAVQREKGEWRLINTDFQYLTDTIYEDVKLNSIEQCVSDGIIFAKTNGNYMMLMVSEYNNSNPLNISVDTTSFVCSDCDLPIDRNVGSNGGNTWFAFAQDNRWGYADNDGNVVIEPKFEEAKSFSNNYAAVLNDKYWGFINTQGDIVITGEFTDAGYMNPEGRCMIQNNNGFWSYIRLYFW